MGVDVGGGMMILLCFYSSLGGLLWEKVVGTSWLREQTEGSFFFAGFKKVEMSQESEKCAQLLTKYIIVIMNFCCF